MNETQWKKGVIQFVKSILSKIEKDDARINKILEDQNIWFVAFTHKSYNPNPGENYEELEKVGDAAAGLAFIEYVYNRFENVTASEIGEYKAHYLSKTEQSTISINLGIPKWIRTPLDKSIHIFEDVLESFFGALLLSGNDVRPGLGYVLCYNLTVYLYNETEFEEDVTLRKSKTQLKELIESVKLKQPEVIFEQDENSPSGIAKLILSKEDFDVLRENGITLKTRVLGQAKGNTKKVAVNKASKVFMDNLAEVKETTAWKNFEKSRKKVDPELTDLLNKANIIGRKQGYVEIFLSHATTGTRGVYIQLLGRDKNDHLDVLLTMSGDQLSNMKKAIVLKYINEN
jgi:dsRNA-specific ribonuclease